MSATQTANHTADLRRFERSDTPCVARPSIEPTNKCAICRNRGGCDPCIDQALKGYGLTGFRG